MLTPRHYLAATFLSLLLAAGCSSSVGEPDPGAGSDGGAAASGCTGGTSNCDGFCVDQDIDDQNCGACGNVCDPGLGCAAGECVPLCDGGQVSCDGTCIDPASSEAHCGASGACTGNTSGEVCEADEVCDAGACLPAITYVGSLPARPGRWSYNGGVGIDAANSACQASYGPRAAICTLEQLQSAQAKGELVGATDTGGVPVDTWHVDDPTKPITRRCFNLAAENLPWTYPTAHLGVGSTFVTLDGTAGTISALTESVGCNVERFVSCCNQPN